MEQVEKGLWLGISIVFFITAMVLAGWYIREINGLVQVLDNRRNHSFIMEYQREDFREEIKIE